MKSAEIPFWIASKYAIIYTVKIKPAGMDEMLSERTGMLSRLALIIGILVCLAAGADAGTTAFVSNRSENTVSVIDVSTGALLRTIPTGGGPQGLALSHDGRLLYVAQALEDTILVLSTEDFSVRNSIATASAPVDIAVSPDGESLYVACRDGIEIIGTADDTIRESLLSVVEPAGLALAPDGLTLFITSAAPGTLTVIDTRDLTPSGVIELGSDFEPSGIRVAPGGDFLYVTGRSSTKTLALAIDTRDLSATGSVELGLEPSGMAFSPDGTLVYVQHAGDGFLSKIRTSDHRLIGQKPYGPLSVDAGVVVTYSAYDAPAGGMAIPIVGAITTPAFLNASAAGLHQINLSWTDNSGNETGFVIERRTSSSAFAEIYRVGLNITHYQDTGLDAYTRYYYRVRAYNSEEYSPYSNEASARTGVTDDDDDDDLFFCAVSYILTGTPYDGHISRLRAFRDRILMKSAMGRAFVKYYYKLSPGLVEMIRQHDLLKTILRALVVPLVHLILYPAVLILLPIFFFLHLLLRRIRTFSNSPA